MEEFTQVKRTILDSGINWNWYLCGDFDEDTKTVHVHYYKRWHKYDDNKHPKSEQRTWMKLQEIEGRILNEIVLIEGNYKVTNPKNIFDYKDFTVLELE